MNATDIIFLFILGFAGYRGYQTGFLVSLLSIISFVIATIMGFAFLHWGVQMLEDLVDGFSEILPYLAFILIFVGVAILINLLGKFLKGAIDLTILGSFDNIAGGVLGMLKWVFGLSLLIWLIDYIGLEVPSDWKNGSVLYAKVEPVAPYIIDILSEYIPFLKSLFKSLGESLRPAVP